MTISTYHTTEATSNSMKPGSSQQYRLLHWLKDILKNFLCDPTNIKDERVAKLMRLQDGATEQELELCSP